MPAGAGWVACRRQPEGRHEWERRRQTGKFKPRIERIFRHGERRSGGDSASELGTSFDGVWCSAGVESSPMRNQRIPGSAPALGCRRVRPAPDMSKMPPACGRIFFNSARGGACWCTRGRARSQGPERCRAFDSPIVPPKVGADRRDARSFRRAAPFRGLPQRRRDAEGNRMIAVLHRKP